MTTKSDSSLVAPLSLRVEKLVPGGQGYARLGDGRVALLQAVAPDDVVEVTEARVRKGYVEVTQWRLLQASPQRAQPPCEYSASCGGCDWMMLSPAAQRASKLGVVREALLRTGKIAELPGELVLVESPQALGYRTRIRLQVSDHGRVGFFSAASHELVEVPRCDVAAPEVNLALQRLRDWARRHPDGLKHVEYVEIRCAPEQRACLHFAGPRITHPALDELREAFILSWRDDAPSADQWHRYPLAPPHSPELVEGQGAVYLEAPPATFTQVNWEVNQLLIEKVVQGALRRETRSFLDLYCGSGNFTLPLLAQGMTGVAIESSAPSIAALRHAAQQQTFSVRAHSRTVEDFVIQAARDGQCYDLVLLDPPRAGIKADLDALVKLAARHIAICSCDPVTLARDLRGLLDRGFVLDEITAFDMFPQTHHVEVLAWLSRA